MSYFNVQRTSVQDVLRKSAVDVPWCYMEDHMGTSIGRVLGVVKSSSEHNFAEWVGSALHRFISYNTMKDVLF